MPPVPKPEFAERIQAAAPGVTDTALARELGIHRNTVRRYRQRARQERQELARDLLAQHVEANIPDALADLTALRRQARDRYEKEGDCRDGQLWLSAIKTTLEHVRPDDRDLDAAIEDELALLAAGGQGAAAPTAPRGAGAPVPPIH